MNKIIEMLKMQKQLDSYIEETNNVKIEREKLVLAILDELGELNHELKANWCWWKKSQKSVDEGKVLAELVDIWHFALSYDNHFGANENFVFWNVYGEDYEKVLRRELSDKLFVMEKIEDRNRMMCRAFLNFKTNLNGVCHANIIGWVLEITIGLGFSLDDVYKAYLEKNKENYERQKRGY